MGQKWKKYGKGRKGAKSAGNHQKVAKKAYSKAKKKVKEFIKKPRKQSTKYRVGDSGNVRKVKKYPGMGS